MRSGQFQLDGVCEARAPAASSNACRSEPSPLSAELETIAGMFSTKLAVASVANAVPTVSVIPDPAAVMPPADKCPDCPSGLLDFPAYSFRHRSW